MSKLVRPHGGNRLYPLLLPKAERAQELKRARSLRQVPMSSRETSDLLMLAMGSYTPLTGFMGADDWRGCCLDMKTAAGLFWPIPITLSCDKDLAAGIGAGEDVALIGDSGAIFGVLQVQEIDHSLTWQKVLHEAAQHAVARVPLREHEAGLREYPVDEAHLD